MSILRLPAPVLYCRLSYQVIAVLGALVSLPLHACEKPPAPELLKFSVRRLPATRAVSIDGSLQEWDEGFVVSEVTPAEAGGQQWRKIRRNAPTSVGSNDFAMRVYMAHDASAWYVGVEIRDDVVMSVEPSSEHAYNGDCLEMFFAGSELDSGTDFREHVETARTPNQRAFFQLLVPPAKPLNRSVHVSTWRTDPALRRHLLNSTDFDVAVRRTPVGWNGELRIPLIAFDESIAGQIRGRSPLRVSVDYLDYDSELASPTDKEHYGFKPDNVFCRCADEDDVNVPRLMPVIVFE